MGTPGDPWGPMGPKGPMGWVWESGWMVSVFSFMDFRLFLKYCLEFISLSLGLQLLFRISTTHHVVDFGVSKTNEKPPYTCI